MDPFSAAGLGLGVVSLALQVFAGCIRGYQLFVDAKGMPKELQHLRVRLRIEQTRLLNWGQKMGLVEESVGRPNRLLEQNRVLIFDVLLEMQNVFKECIVFENAHQRHESRRGLGDRGLSFANDTFKQRFPKAMDAFLQKTLGVLDKAADTPDRLLWAMIKRDKFEGLVSKLIGCNTAIEALMDTSSIAQLQHMQHQTYLALLQLNTSVAELKEVSVALQIKPERSANVSETARHRDEDEASLNEGTVDVARLADFKAQQIEIEAQPSQTIHIDSLKLTDIGFGNTTGSHRSMASYKGVDVWFERKYTGIDLSLHPRRKKMIEERIQKLVLLLQPSNKPPEFNAPQCLGYFWDEDEDCFGFLHACLPQSAQGSKPWSLLQIIKAQQEGLSPPSLTKRIRVAHSIARSLLYIHSVNWIHKGFRSDNIIFFQPPSKASPSSPTNRRASLAPQHHRPLDISLTPLIAGFEYARPDSPEEETEPPPEHADHDIYRHGGGTSSNAISRSQKSHDIYSLGIVLVEIAYWQPINQIMEIPDMTLPTTTSASKAGQFQTSEARRGSVTAAQNDKAQKILQKEIRKRIQMVRHLLLDDVHNQYLSTMASRMGEAYAEAVRRCLSGGEALGIPEGAVDESGDVNVGVSLQETFAREVVGRLGGIRT